MKVLVIGKGQIGTAIHAIVSRKNHEVHIRDIADYELGGVDVLHICYPDSLYFVQETMAYMAKYSAKLTIVHSSVAVGKTNDLGDRAVHCPVRGRHPNLESQIPAFPMFVGGDNKETVREACEYLNGLDLICKPVFDSMATEVCKLLSNVHMGLEVAWRQEVGRILNQFCIDPQFYHEWEDTYNEGYRITGDEQLTRPRLNPDPIGGHCILECTEILGKQFHSKLFDFIKESNDIEKTKRNGHSDAPKSKVKSKTKVRAA